MAQKKSKKAVENSVGRPSREAMGLETTKQFTVWVEPSIVAKLRKKHGTLGNALRAAVAQ